MVNNANSLCFTLLPSIMSINAKTCTQKKLFTKCTFDLNDLTLLVITNDRINSLILNQIFTNCNDTVF